MPIPNQLPKDITDVLQGDPWGKVFPQRANPPPLSYDGRSVAMRTLKRYLAAINFRRPGGRDAKGNLLPPIDFQIPEKQIQIGWPDYEETLDFPHLTFLHGPGDYNMIGLTSYIEEDTKDKYGLGTVVQWMSEYTEVFDIEIWASKRAELRAIIAGIETALSPFEQMYGIRFRLPEYFNQLARFSLWKRQEYDEQDAARGRRRARVSVELAHHIVAPVNYTLVIPQLQVSTDADVDFNSALDADCVPPNTPTPTGPCDPCG